MRRAERWALVGETTRKWRSRRYETFMRLCEVRPDETILDVGAGRGSALARFNQVNPIVATDIVKPTGGGHLGPNVEFLVADAQALPFVNREFPVAFSNSVIEHVPDQEAFAREVRRVADRYFVQTPNKWFPIEPHYQFPLIQFLPRRALPWVTRRLQLGHMPRGEPERIRLLSARELQRLFPDAEIHRERLFGFTKSFMAVRKTNSS